MIIAVAEYIPLRKLCQLLPSRPHIATAHRWSTRGVRGVRLKTFLVGGLRTTTLADFEGFVAAVSAASTSQDQATTGQFNRPPDTATLNKGSRQRDIAKAEQVLDRRGVNIESAGK